MDLLTCPTCQLAVSVEMTGGEPYCPRCRTRLEVIESASAIWPVLESGAASDEPPTLVESASWPDLSTMGSVGGSTAGSEEVESASSNVLSGDAWQKSAAVSGEGVAAGQGGAEPAGSSSPSSGSSTTAGGAEPAGSRLPGEWVGGANDMETGLETGPELGTGPGLSTGTAGASRAGGRARSSWAWQALLTYASLVTLLAVYLAWQLSKQPAQSRLDLPDLAPPLSKGSRVTTLIHIREGQRLPASHVLKLGEARQFGTVEVTPLRVTRGPLQFEYFDKQTPRQREPSEEVWRLHVRFRNLSTDLPVTPLDRHLVYSREEDRKQPGRFKANNFVAARNAGPGGAVVPVYDLSPDSDWVVVDQNLDREVPPGEIVEAFLPSETQGLDQLTGPLKWRLHFRKGHNPNSLRGVTTVVEVQFDAGDVEAVKAAVPPVEVPAATGAETTFRGGASPRSVRGTTEA